MKHNLLCLHKMKCEAITLIKRSHHLSLKWHWCDWCWFLTIPLQERQALWSNIIFFLWPLSVWRNKIFWGVSSSRDLETNSVSTTNRCLSQALKMTIKCWRPFSCFIAVLHHPFTTILRPPIPPQFISCLSIVSSLRCYMSLVASTQDHRYFLNYSDRT